MACSFKENRHITGRFVEEFRLIIPMHRLFVAIRPPSAIRKALLSIMGGVEGARWQSDDQLHLTLRFIGDVDRHRADDIPPALATEGGAPYTPRLSAAALFDHRGRLDSFLASITPPDEIRVTHKKIDCLCKSALLTLDHHLFAPLIDRKRLIV